MEIFVYEKKSNKQVTHKIFTGKEIVTRVNGSVESVEPFEIEDTKDEKLKVMIRSLSKSGYRYTDLKIDFSGNMYEQIRLF